MRVAFRQLGCKLNQAELEAMAREFTAAGHRVVAETEEPDLFVVNTCTVTQAAARDSRKAARKGSRLGATRTVITGCYVESDREEAAALAGVDLVVANADKERLLEIVERRFPELATNGQEDLPYLPIGFGHSRALVKIEDGCDMQCSFCIIPSTRGRQRSRAPEEVVTEVRGLIERGFEEVVVTGVQISSYRYGEARLYDLTRRMLAETSGARFRLSSIAPWEFDERLLDLFVDDRICRHFHLSLQSGDGATLRRMRRPYDTDGFATLTRRIRRRVPGIALTTDVIVGFPGETDEAFERSLAFVEGERFARIHAFPFSSRPGTPAAALPDPVPHETIRARMRRMLAVAENAERDFARRQLGSTGSVLWEAREGDLWRGTTDNYVRVRALSSRDLGRQVVPAELLSIEGGWIDARVSA